MTLATKDDIREVRQEMAEMKSELLRSIYVVGLIQFLAIITAVIGILSFMLKGLS